MGGRGRLECIFAHRLSNFAFLSISFLFPSGFVCLHSPLQLKIFPRIFPSRRFRTILSRKRHRLYIEKYQHDNRKTFTHLRAIRASNNLLNFVSRSNITYAWYMCVCVYIYMMSACARIYTFLIIHIYIREECEHSVPYFFLFSPSSCRMSVLA